METRLLMLLLFCWGGVAWGQENIYEKGLGDSNAKEHYTQKNTFVLLAHKISCVLCVNIKNVFN